MHHVLQGAGIGWGAVSSLFAKTGSVIHRSCLWWAIWSPFRELTPTQDLCQDKELAKALCFSKWKDFLSFCLLQKTYQTLGSHSNLCC